MERANAMGEDAINMIFDEFAGSVGSDISGLNAEIQLHPYIVLNIVTI